MRERGFQRVLVVVAHRCDHRPRISRWHREGGQVCLCHGLGAKARQLSEPGQRVCDRGVAENKQQRAWHSRLYENVERTTARTCRGHHELALFASLPDLLGGHDLDELRGALGKGSQSLAPDDRFRTASTDPAPQPAVGGDDRLVPRAGRGRRFDTHDGGQHARCAIGSILTQQLQYVVRYSATPLDRSAAPTLSEVTGMSMLVMPYGDRASITALTNAAGDPTVADSPTPLAPSGWCGEGVTVWPISNLGVSHAVGMR